MKINKFIVLTLLFMLIASIGNITFADEQLYNLKALDIVPTAVNEANLDGLITRGEFAYMAAKMMKSGEQPMQDTHFADVKKDNVYSGYIAFMSDNRIMNGTGGNMFSPNGNVSVSEAYKIIIGVIGYSDLAEKNGGYPDGYIKLAGNLNLNLCIKKSEGFLTKRDAVELTNYVLTVDFGNSYYQINNGNVNLLIDNKDESSILNKRFGISVYSAVVDKVNAQKNSMSVTITKNKYDTNPVVLKSGQAKTFTFKVKDSDIFEYEKMPVTIWVNEDEEIKRITVSKNAEVKYGYISSVNDDERKDSSYSIKYIDNLTLLDDENEYDVSDNAVLRFDNYETISPVYLTGNFVKLVIIDGEVTFVESWSLSEGGIITNINSTELIYTKGERSNFKIKDLDSIKTKRIFVDNDAADSRLLSNGAVFDYYLINENLVIVASTKQITDTLYSYSEKKVEIGNAIYISDVVYCSEDGDTYKAGDIFKMLKRTVTAYVAPDGYVRYLKLGAGQTSNNTEFIGVLGGINEDVFGEEADVEIYDISANVVKKQFKLTKKTEYSMGLSYSIIKETANNLEGRGVYKFITNGNNVITSIEKMSAYDGYDNEATVSVNSFADATNGYVTIGNKRLFFVGAPLVAIYDLDGKFTVSKITFENLRGRVLGTSITMKFYGDEVELDPVLGIVTGDLSSLGASIMDYGIVINKNQKLNDDGELCVDIEILDGNSQILHFTVSEDYAKTIPNNSLISYNYDCAYSKNEIYVMSIVDLSSKGDWPVVDNENAAGLHKGIVKDINGNRIRFTDGTAYFYYLHSSDKLFAAEYINDSRQRFEGITYNDIEPGDEVYYYLLTGGLIRAIIKV